MTKRKERNFPCETCLRLQAEPVRRCSECERLQRFEKRIDPTTLFIAIEAETFFCQKRCDWERRIEYMERTLSLMKKRMLDFRMEKIREEIMKETHQSPATRQKYVKKPKDTHLSFL